MIGRYTRASLPVLLLCPLLGAHAGGWATITVEDLPDYAVAQQQLDLAFTVRQHGVEPMNDLSPVVVASSGNRRTTATAKRGKAAGEYHVALTLPEPGDWTINIDTRFGDSQVTLLPMRATGGGAFAPPTFTPGERGRRLFVAKGCITCHQHRDFKAESWTQFAPDLSEPRLASDYLAKFLADPSIRPPTGNSKMPNLRLKEAEIAALVAYLNTKRK